MSWIEKRQPSNLDELQIEGLYYLDGAMLVQMLLRTYGTAETPFFSATWLKEQKLPQVEFPSGLSFDILETHIPERGAIIHIFGEMDLPYFHTRDEAFDRAFDIAKDVGYVAKKHGDNQLEVRGQDDDEHFLITYDNTTRRMVDIKHIEKREAQTHPPRIPLLDQASRGRLPKLYANEHIGVNALAQVKFFSPSSNWTWYASEASAAMRDGSYKALTEVDHDDSEIEDVIFFGLVNGFELELGYFSLNELEQLGGGLQLPIERDRHFTPKSLNELQQRYQKK